jgi:hypothetical protein
MIHYRQIEHLGVLQGAPHQFMVLHTMPVVGNGDDPRLFQRTNGRQFRHRGRQMAHIDLGRGVLDRVAIELKDIAKIEQEPKLEGRNMSMVLGPK